MVIFDPYNDRLARDIRNSLSSALVKELTGYANSLLSAVADDWIAMAHAPTYITLKVGWLYIAELLTKLEPDKL